MVEDRWRGVVSDVNFAVEVDGPHPILCAVIQGNIVAVLLDLALCG